MNQHFLITILLYNSSHTSQYSFINTTTLHSDSLLHSLLHPCDRWHIHRYLRLVLLLYHLTDNSEGLLTICQEWRFGAKQWNNRETQYKSKWWNNSIFRPVFCLFNPGAVIDHKFITVAHTREWIGYQHGSLYTCILPWYLMHVILKKTIVMMCTTLYKGIISIWETMKVNTRSYWSFLIGLQTQLREDFVNLPEDP